MAGPVLMDLPCSPYLHSTPYTEESLKSPVLLPASPEILADYNFELSPAYLTAWEHQIQASSTPPFLHAVAHSTPLLPFTSPSNCPSPPMISDLPSISDECPSPKPDSSPKPLLNPSISRFHLMGTLGCGAYGKVLLGYLGDDTNSGNNLHAIKVLRKADMNQYGVEEVKRELRALRWIADTDQAPFLQKMTASFQNERFVFIEYHPVSLANSEISSRLRLKSKRQRLPVSVSLPLTIPPPYQNVQENSMTALRLLAAELFMALRFLHENGIIHQDVKPDNIMLSQSGHVVLSDFGASTALPFSLEYDDFPVSSSSSAKATKTYHPVVLQGEDIVTFTPRYAAPELLHRNDANLVIYDERVDWFSYGVLLYELATGYLPFEAEGPMVDARSRRSVGDFSLAFGKLEKLVYANATKSGSDCALDSSHLESFIKALLVHQASDRLTGDDIKTHAFFDAISSIWDEIAGMQHPPLPFPSSAALDPDISLSMNPKLFRRAEDAKGKDHSFADNLLEEAGLRVTWPVPRRCNDSIREEDDWLRDGDSGIAMSPQSSEGFGDMAGSSSGSNGEDVDLDEDASEIQPFPSTASIMFSVSADGTIHKMQHGPSHRQNSLPGVHEFAGIRRLVPSLCSDESLVDISCEADVSSFIDGDSTNIDFEEEQTRDAVSLPSRAWSPPVASLTEAIFSPRPAIEELMIPRSQSQRRTLSGLSNAPAAYAGHTQINHANTDVRSSSLSRRFRHSSAPFPRNPSSPRFTDAGDKREPSTRHSIHTHHPNKAHLSLPLINDRHGSRSRSHDRRTSLPAWTPSYPSVPHQKLPRYNANSTTTSPSQLGNRTASTFNDKRMRKVSESWTLEEELTISVLNAMDRRASFTPSTGVKRAPSRSSCTTRHTEWNSCVSKARGDVYRTASESFSPPPLMTSTKSEPLPPRKRRASVLMKRQKSEKTPSPSTPPSPSPLPRRSLGGLWKKLRRLSGF
uniref:non-specific serine/threonine protein kinase n=1 Tax=Moniliophthora roreri TaxID=221103 RepID=A0A0W0FBB1_MONRR